MASLKDILRNIASTVNSSSVDIQPIIDLIDNFITTQEFNTDRELDKVNKFSSELFSIYNSIQDYPQKFYIFLKCMRASLPVLGPDVVISDWYDKVLLQILKSSLQPKDIVEEVKGIIREVLVCETDRTMAFRKEILELYLNESSMIGKPAGEGYGVVGEQVHAFWCRNLENVLRGFGSVKTKDFFVLLDSYFIRKQYRLQILNLLGEFIQRQSLNIHHILETSLFDSLLTSLQRDTSTTLISLSLTTLVMLLPHICTSIIAYLPRLYIVFIRIICWDKHDSRCADFDSELIGNNLNTADIQRTDAKTDAESDWERYSTFDSIPSTPPNCSHLFTILYGMFPCNTVEFLRNPTVWIKNMNCIPFYGEIDDDVIRSRSMPLLRRHTLHPNLILSNAERELSDTSRWIKLEPADVVAECIGYDMENASTTKHQISELEDFTKNVLEGVESTNVETKTIRTRRSSQAISIQEIMDVHQALKSGVEIVVGDDPWDSKIISSNSISSTSPPDSNLSVPQSLGPLSNAQASVAFLQREVMLLRNELNFELYLKQQHLQHIGRLHRDHVLDISAEAERHNLYNACKNLKLQLEKTQAAFNRQREDNASIKKKHVQWEDELNNKLKKYREEKKEWKTELDKVEEQLREAKLTIKAQAKQIEEANTMNFKLENDIKVSEPQLQKLTEYENRIDQLTKQLLLWEADTRKFQEQKYHMEILVAQWNKMEMMLETKDKEINQLRITVNSQSLVIDDLKIKSESLSQNQSGQGTALEKQMQMWTFERDKRDKELKKLETDYEMSQIIELSAKIESLDPPKN
ncbi:26429_t:CDS:10 [Dentiscutata erythropus]|uniref:26429_t:CDS:1 n=1 Tax=Dentiscutata erythropus TaxID=1348616 RepID=A0A9N8ZD25_9GLOM|nr:26429_t:CDS:10 [Dentiscutata erythropus]